MKICISSSSARPPTDVALPDDATVLDLKRSYRPQVSDHRKSFRIEGEAGAKPIALSDVNKRLAEYGVRDGTRLLFKDLGPQIGYRTVFVVEYAGPIALMGIFALRPTIIYGSGAVMPYSPIALFNIGLFLAHFLKREFETFFVHKFSRPTMPLFNLFKNSVYYWSFAAFIGYFLCHPLYTAPAWSTVAVGTTIFAACEFLNGAVHYQLSTMRRGDGDMSRDVPKGILFRYVSCPNYLFEVSSWVGFSLSSGVLFSYGFTLVGLAQMSDWALKKHHGYIKDAKSEEAKKAVRRRKAIIPFLL